MLKDLSVGCGALSLFNLFLILLIPESPYYNLMKKDSEKARVSLKFLLGSDDKVNQEIDIIRKFLAEVRQVYIIVESKLTKKHVFTD